MLRSTTRRILLSRRSFGTVRVILRKDVENVGYTNDVVKVRAGYARNFLVPHKTAVYASRSNFRSLNLKDPDLETYEERQQRLALEISDSANQNLKAANLLQTYLASKTLVLRRQASPEDGSVSPGHVSAQHVRQKLSKKLKIDLNKKEKVHLRKTALKDPSQLSEQEVAAMMEELGDAQTDCTVQIRDLGEYMARITLEGDYQVPLFLRIEPR